MRRSVGLLALCSGAVIASCTPQTGSQPILSSMRSTAVTSSLRSASAFGRPRASFHILFSFTGSDGAHPRSNLIIFNNKMYGTTSEGGKNYHFCRDGCGVVFDVGRSGRAHVYKLSPVYGVQPDAGLTLVVKPAMLLGTASEGGSGFGGAVFAMHAGTGPSPFHSFCSVGVDGANPLGGLVSLKNDLYGTTSRGCRDNQEVDGAVFQMDLSGSDRLLYQFTGGNGAFPHGDLAVLHGLLYGATSEGGTGCGDGCGIVFEVRAQGGGQTLYTFNGLDGAHPYAPVTVWHGLLYGTTRDGGAFGKGTVFELNPFTRKERVLYSFSGSDGAHPYAGLTLWRDLLYGTTYDGGASGSGTVFELNPTSKKENVLYSFSGSDGAHPYAGLTVWRDALYGTTYDGGAQNMGTIFDLTL